MAAISFIQSDGGRAAAGFRGEAGDCATRAIAIALGLPYRQVYEELQDRQRLWLRTGRPSKAKRAMLAKSSSSVRNGTAKAVITDFLSDRGWIWTPTMHVGRGTQVHLRADELPAGRLICRLSRHVAAVVDGVLHDTHDCSRDGCRAVYGFYSESI